MTEYDDINFLFDISKQVKAFYEMKVIFVNQKDYSELVYNTLCALREAVRTNNKDRLLELVVEYHIQWLHAINDIESWYNTAKTNFIPEDMCHVISFTIDAFNNRIKNVQAYMNKNRDILGLEERTKLDIDFEIIEELHTDVSHSLFMKIKDIRQSKTQREFMLEVEVAIDELFQWLDCMNDSLTKKLCKYIQGTEDFSVTVQKIIDNLKNTDTAETILNGLKAKGKRFSSMILYTVSHSLEIEKVGNKINFLDDGIKRLEPTEKKKPSAAFSAIIQKKHFLEERLAEIELERTTLNTLRDTTTLWIDDMTDEEMCSCEDFFQLRIFNHWLPSEHRERLVTELCYLWDVAIFGDRSNKSIISILSATDMKEEYTDEMGTFCIDEHSRKIYKLPDDNTRYQPNEHNELVPVSDDADHVYFYDECGRYFIDPLTQQRVYKAHATASEYMMDSFGVLLKMKEEKNGVTYYYDNFGSYYINKDGKHVYRDPDGSSEYENDGLGNLVRIRSHLELFEPCAGDAYVTEDFRYLKEVVGKALRVCIGQVLLLQPQDPIKYLSECLIRYRENIELKDKRARENEELKVERDIIEAEERAAAEKAALEAALQMQGGSEASYDSNLINYVTTTPRAEV